MKRLIAFAGRARSGKDTGAAVIEGLFDQHTLKTENRNGVTLKFAFANILKDIAQTSLKINPDDAERLKAVPSAKVANGLTIREFYNTLGDSIKRYFGQDVWINIIAESVQNTQGIDLLIITDLRYSTEEVGLREVCKNNDIELTIIKMKNLNHSQRDDNIPVTEHESEYLVDSIKEDYLVSARDVPELIGKLEDIFIQLVEGENNESNPTTVSEPSAV